MNLIWMRLISTSCGPPSEICGGNFPSIHLLIRFDICAIDLSADEELSMDEESTMHWHFPSPFPPFNYSTFFSFFFGELTSFLCEKTIHESESSNSQTAQPIHELEMYAPHRTQFVGTTESQIPNPNQWTANPVTMAGTDKWHQTSGSVKDDGWW